jgi:hypothetical protein
VAGGELAVDEGAAYPRAALIDDYQPLTSLKCSSPL